MNKIKKILSTTILSVLCLTIGLVSFGCAPKDKTNDITYVITGLGLSYDVGDDVLVDNAQISYLNKDNVWVSKKITSSMVSGFDSSKFGTYTADIVIDSDYKYTFTYNVNFANSEQIRDFIQHDVWSGATVFETHKTENETILYAYLDSKISGNYYYITYDSREQASEGLARYIKSNDKEEWYNVERVGNICYLFRYTKTNDKCTKELVNSPFENTYEKHYLQSGLSEYAKTTVKNGYVYFDQSVRTSVNGVYGRYNCTYRLKKIEDYWYIMNATIKNEEGNILEEIEYDYGLDGNSPTINRNVPKVFEDKTPVKVLGLYEKNKNEYVEFDYTNTSTARGTLVCAKVVCADGEERFVPLQGLNGSASNDHGECRGRVDFENKKISIKIMQLTYVSDIPAIS